MPNVILNSTFKQIPAGKRVSTCHNLLDNIGEINKQSVQQLSQETKQILRENSPVRLKELAQLNCIGAETIKNHLDNRFGEGNYVILSIGRSISSITKLMEHMGAEVKMLPLSGLRRTGFETASEQDLQIYKNFLKDIGLSKEALNKNKDKKYIIMDYAYHGRTINKTEAFLKRDDILGDADNLIKMPVYQPLGDKYEGVHFDTLLSLNRFKDYSCVGKLNINSLKDVYKQATPETATEYQGNITKGMRKLFWFNVFDALTNRKYKNFNVDNEFKAIYEHNLSPKAIQNYIKRDLKMVSTVIQEL